PQKRGGGLDFVRKPEYGRSRWLEYPAKKNKNRMLSMRDGGIVALPQLTDEQRAAALEKAAAARRARAELKDRLKRGGTNLTQVLKDAETDEVLGKMKVSALLQELLTMQARRPVAGRLIRPSGGLRPRSAGAR